MDDFLKELSELLLKHSASIVRSANSSNSLVIGVYKKNSLAEEVEFDEEIDESDISGKRFRSLR